MIAPGIIKKNPLITRPKPSASSATGFWPDSNFFCNGFKEFGNMKFHCWAKNGHGKLNLTQAIERSCDVYFYELGLKVGIEKIAEIDSCC